MERLVVNAVANSGVYDLHQTEIDFCLDGIVSAVALKAVDTVTDGKKECLSLKSVSGQLDFETLPRHELLKHLEHCSGLPEMVCAKVLDSINLLISAGIRGRGRIRIEHLGEMVCRDDGHFLILEERLQVHKLKKP